MALYKLNTFSKINKKIILMDPIMLQTIFNFQYYSIYITYIKLAFINYFYKLFVVY